MGSSPTDTTKNGESKSPVQDNAPPLIVAKDSKQDDSIKPETSNTEPLAPPPRPAPAVGSTPDYFSVGHSAPSGLSYETNPFETSFAGGSGGANGELRTPGGTKLPSVRDLTSPSGNLGGATPTPFWGSSLRSGPLSPAMLSGPQKDDYFSDGHHLRGGFPTPNESGLRSGLTPGGGGSMFPEPSPNTQAFLQLSSGVATPSTLDFHRTAMSAAAAHKREITSQSHHNVTSQPQDSANVMDVKSSVPGQFDQHDANDAANGLFLLAQTSAARNGSQQTNHYTMAPQMPVHAHPQPGIGMGGQSNEASPNMGARNQNGGSISTTSGRGISEMSDDIDQVNRPNTRGKGKRNSTTVSQTNGRGKNETPSKGPANKKSKANNGRAMSLDEPPSDEEPDMSKDEYNANGKKMTDEEKRKNFLERNRVAALKCRQRKKQWLANLQHKVEIFTSENDQLNAQIAQLRDEVVNLKTLLLAHKDCPISQQQGLAGLHMQQMIENGAYGGQMNPYGMAGMGQQQQVMAGQGMQRRFS